MPVPSLNRISPGGRHTLGRLVAMIFAVRGLTAVLAASALQFAGANVELVLSETSDGAMRVQLLPFLEREQPAALFSNVLVPFVAKELLRTRALDGAAVSTVIGERLRATVKNNPLTVTVTRADDAPVQELVFDAGEIRFATAAPVLGLGEGARQFDRRGGLYTMNPSWGDRERPFRGSVVPSPFLIGTEGWAMFIHTPEGQFDLREPVARFTPRPGEAGGAAIDVFIISVQQPADALAHYIALTGRPAMPPKWALGYAQSHRTLSGPDQPLAIAHAFRERRLPCDALIYLGTGYCPNGWNTGHGSLEFNPAAFDQPAAQIAALHDQHFKIVLHVNRAPEGLTGRTVSEASDSPQHLSNYWVRHRPTFALGVDGWWPDDGDELPLAARLIRHQLYYEGALQERPNLRPWSLHRTGSAGAQRFGGWIWSGDTDCRWSILALQIPVALNHGLSLTPFWGSDTGGFFPTPELTGELYARWFQFSAFCPSFRSHGRTWNLRLPWGWNTSEFGPKEYPDEQHPDAAELHNAAIEPICRKYLELRYRMLPYNYTVAREAVDTGLPMMRALWLHYPNDATATALADEYLWGRDVLVAPVVEKGTAQRRIYLPAGLWHDWWTAEKFDGGRWIERPVDLATLPLYVRAGAIIPLDPVRQYTEQVVEEPTMIRVFPGADGTFTLYDDDGRSLGYRDGTDVQSIWIKFRWNDATRTLSVESDERMRSWPGGTRSLDVDVAGENGSATRIEFKGERVTITR